MNAFGWGQGDQEEGHWNEKIKIFIDRKRLSLKFLNQAHAGRSVRRVSRNHFRAAKVCVCVCVCVCVHPRGYK